ncbi:hypothetical protein K458DRAFT_329214 [Lentithecium fluviatile CBS 122367]|uniref:Heterokaryon incompatibility domain-containing protein n=1 Tax=Lentithecium fluviatile CBS 122367 TaxID=1168545 RepID=A0A6G1JFZ3_9PLEO|nr:hypothetical protein K458DRAFT_329214 [Lentithecium fluviatile CBS 122367]
MRLLNTTTLKLAFFIDNAPPYVILSHTWGDGEVTFDDIDKPYAKDMAGYSKIVCCCRQAVLDGFEWVWIDTCCIDKRSSSELSESINSMYRYYWQAEICYAYLVDATFNEYAYLGVADIRWFQRGWTLQELLAPSVVEFYNQEWQLLGTKCGLATIIQHVTRIEKKYLLDRHSIQDASVATKFSWASLRQTTRVEDTAYCLLGLVDVNMTMLYGEGTKAFYRLQLELLKKSNEHTIFTWELAKSLTGPILCPSPAGFFHSSRIRPTQEIVCAEHEMTNRGLRMRLPCIWEDGRCLAILNCQYEDHLQGGYIGIWLEDMGNEQFRRVHRHLQGRKESLTNVSAAAAQTATVQNMYIMAANSTEDWTGPQRYQIRVCKPSTENSAYRLEGMVTITKWTTPITLASDALEAMNRGPLTLCDYEIGGQNNRRLWYQAIGGLDVSQMVDVLKKAIPSKEVIPAPLGDYQKLIFNDKTKVSISAKKKRIASTLWWDLSIEVKDV